jgi:enoyl-CoA hydratase
VSKLVAYQSNGSVATIIMDDGKVNVISPAMLSELNDALDRALREEAIVLLAGRPGVFSAGFDLTVLKAGGIEAANMVKGGFELAERLLSFPRPVVIACTGHAIAMGAFLVLSADYRIGAEGDFKIGANEVAIGLTMPNAAIEICRQRLVPAHFQRAVICAEMYAPTDAVMAGFLDQVAPAAEVVEAAEHAAAQLSQLNSAAHTATKLRARDQSLKNLRRAIETDDVEFRTWYRGSGL